MHLNSAITLEEFQELVSSEVPDEPKQAESYTWFFSYLQERANNSGQSTVGL